METVTADGRLRDFGPHGLHGTGVMEFVTGAVGRAARFDSVADRIDLPEDVAFDLRGAVTVAAWLRPTESATQYLVKKARHKEIDGYELSLSRSGKMFVRFNQPSSGNAYRANSVSTYPVDGVTNWDGSGAGAGASETDGIITTTRIQPVLSSALLRSLRMST